MTGCHGDLLSVGFPPIARADARVLILGSLPGPLSLRLGHYYANPRNAFWRIAGALFGAGPELAYRERIDRLTAHNVALWDVCHAAIRPGALDAAIVPASVVPNDFPGFLAAHPRVARVCFNGARAAELFRRLVLPGLPGEPRGLRLDVLPSTSPAHAATPFEAKLRHWRAALLAQPL